eukprot:scaffold1347_cov350-Pavlova_lutheri.AAC.40
MGSPSSPHGSPHSLILTNGCALGPTLRSNATQLQHPHRQGQAPPNVKTSMKVTIHELAIVGGFVPHQALDRNRFLAFSKLG